MWKMPAVLRNHYLGKSGAKSEEPAYFFIFRNIGRADWLGSGIRNLYKYSKYYSGAEPTFMEGDVFRIIVSLNDAYSFGFGQNGQLNQSNQTELT